MRPLLKIGHRGAAGHAPENTLAAIRKGIELGADSVEIDLRCTEDGVLVALHDATVNRTTKGKGRVDTLSLADIRTLNAGKDERIPTLEEVLSVATGKAGVMLELKVAGLAHLAAETVRRTGFKGPVIYASFLHEELPHVRSVDRDALLMVLFGRLPRAPVARAMAQSPTHVGLRHDTVTRRLVEEFHREDLLVWVYTADNRRDIQRVISIGVDGVISNFPDRIGRQQ